MDWVWFGWLARGFITLLVGLWKCGKTTLLAHLLKATARGGNVAGEVVPCKVLVIAEEGAGLWARRRDDIGIADNVHFLIRPFKGRPTACQWAAFTASVASRVKADSFQVVVVDTWQSINPSFDENDAAQTMAAVMPLHLLTEAGAAVLLIHHPRKGDAAEGQASRGSGALPGFVDTIAELRRYDPERQDDRRRTLRGLSRFEETPAELVIELRDGGYHMIGTKADAKQADRWQVIGDLLTGEPTTPDTILAAWPDNGVPRPGKRTLDGDLNAGYAAGQWLRAGQGVKGDPYRYSKCDSRKPQMLGAGNESNGGNATRGDDADKATTTAAMVPLEREVA